MKPVAKVLYILSSLSAFLVLARNVRQGRTGDLDARVTMRLQAIEHPTIRRLLHDVSWPGFPPQSRILPWLIPGAMLAVARPFEAGFQLMGWGTGAISGLVKFIVKRPRPAIPGIEVASARISGSSFPSGHVIIYTGVYGMLAYLAHCHIRFSILRRAVVALLGGLIALVGPSRVFLGHHWFSDVLASYLLGTSYLMALTTVYQRARRSRAILKS
ncbi:hypothetical protein BH23CHL5_BH23CHL5_14820 [soil metagenome]